MKTWRSLFIPIVASLASVGIHAQSTGQQTSAGPLSDTGKMTTLSLSYVAVSEFFTNFANMRDDNINGNLQIAADSTMLAREMTSREMLNHQPECACVLCPPRGVLWQHFKNPAGIYHSFGGGVIGGSGH